MAVDAGDAQVRQAGGVLVGGQCIGKGNAEFIGFQAGGNIRVGLCVHIGVDAQRNGRGFAQARGHRIDAV